MNYYDALKLIAVILCIAYAVHAEEQTIDNVIKSNYENHGLDGYLLQKDERSGLLVPPKPLSNLDLRDLIVDSKWKNKYCKVSVDYTILNQAWYDHYCLEKLKDGPNKGLYKNLCCGGKSCDCQWANDKPFKCDCVLPKVIQ